MEEIGRWWLSDPDESPCYLGNIDGTAETWLKKGKKNVGSSCLSRLRMKCKQRVQARSLAARNPHDSVSVSTSTDSDSIAISLVSGQFSLLSASVPVASRSSVSASTFAIAMIG